MEGSVCQSTLMLDSTTIKDHQHGGGTKKGMKKLSNAAGKD